MAIYNFMSFMVIMFMVHSYGNGQMIKQKFLCNYFNSEYSNCTGLSRSETLSCDPYYVIMITNVSLGYYNETEEQTCCQKIPDNICTVEVNKENNLGYYYYYASSCALSHTCVIDLNYYYGFLSNDNNCSFTQLLTYTEYMCVSNTSILNMTKPGMNHNLNSFSLAYTIDRYPEIDNHFYCSCEITVDDDDVYIYTTVSFLGLNVVYNTSVTIYSPNHTVRYDVNNTDMTNVDNFGYKHLLYKQLKQTKGPIYLVYEGDELQPYIDKIWIDFKASKGRLNVNCKGCRSGYSIPPVFNVPPTVQMTDLKGTMGTTSPINKTALISVLVIIAVLGLVMMGVVFYKKRKCIKDKIETAKYIPTKSEPVSDVPTASRTVSEIETVSGNVSNIPTVSGTDSLPPVSGDGSEMYDTLEMNNQLVDVYSEYTDSLKLTF
ncbi:uncharacterized protein LOC126810252 [Patella vulgata]|uniref:uncharacterized protein LOC126810252 n=1 Tax=Patella vulgata TaxID=6465 RepID=UPI0024A87AC4|nr:uncharacterized protein LOC126810252 [Patella vulgata]